MTHYEIGQSITESDMKDIISHTTALFFKRPNVHPLEVVAALFLAAELSALNIKPYWTFNVDYEAAMIDLRFYTKGHATKIWYVPE